jgi:hypothetical protein
MHPTSIDAGTLARTSMPQPGVLGADKTALRADVEQAKRALAMDIGQLVLDITGIIDPTPISDGANFLISLARRNWVDAVASAVSIVPYIGDLAKTAKLPRYIRSVRKAIDIARFDFRWARALRELFAKLKQVLDECSKLADDLLPDAAIKQLKALKDEIDNFLSMKGGTTGKPSGSGKKTGSQSSSTTKSQSKSDSSKPTGKVDRKHEKEYGPGKDDGPKKTPKGFSSADDFAQFGKNLKSGLKKAGFDDVQPFFQGSSVTGKSFRTGKPFDVGRVSDFDVALSSPKMLQKAKELGIPLRSQGVRTGPLKPVHLEKLGLTDIASQLSNQAGRPVNFMIFDSAATATTKAPSILVP